MDRLIRLTKWHENRLKARTKVRTFWTWGCRRMSPAPADGYVSAWHNNGPLHSSRDNGAGRQDVEVYQIEYGVHYVWYTVCQNSVNVFVICFRTYKCSPSSPSLSIWYVDYLFAMTLAGTDWLTELQCCSNVIHPIIVCTWVHTRVHVRVSGNCC